MIRKKYIIYIIAGMLFSCSGNQEQGNEHGTHEHEGHDHESHGHEDHGHGHGPHEQIIEFSEADVKAEGLVIRKVRKDTVFEVIHTSGEVKQAPGERNAIVARTSGIVVYADQDLAPGSKVATNTPLFTVVGQGMTNYSLKADYQKAKSKFEKAKSQFDRKNELLEANAISEADFEAARMEMEIAKAELDQQREYFTRGGKQVTAGINGWVTHFHIKNGEYVETGDKIAEATATRNLQLVGYVPLADAGKLDDLHSATFAVDGKVYDLSDMSGEFVAHARTIEGDHPRIPVTYKFVNDGTVFPGTYAEVNFRLLPKPVRKGIIIPSSALLEDYGRYQVVVKVHHGEYVLRTVQVGVSDGRWVEIRAGLKDDDLIVVKGAYRIKMASMSGQGIGHGHGHAH